MNEIWVYVASAVGVVGGIYTIVEKIFGGGNKLARQFADLDSKCTTLVNTMERKMNTDLTSLRVEFLEKVDGNNENSRVGFNAITANIHALQLGFSEFRTMMAENYMRRESFHKAMDEWKKDFKEIFTDMKQEMRTDFKELRDEIGAVSQSVEAARRANNN